MTAEQYHNDTEMNGSEQNEPLNKPEQCRITTDQINLLSKKFKFILSPVTNESNISHQLMEYFDHFAR